MICANKFFTFPKKNDLELRLLFVYIDNNHGERDSNQAY